MNILDEQLPKWALDGLTAMRRAASEARRIGIETDTGIIRVVDGKTVHVSAAELREEAARETGRTA
jgi:hypothetical protein